ncbi:uncharacterized protein WCI35_004227, partial [Daubentonia madagascariensis]
WAGSGVWQCHSRPLPGQAGQTPSVSGTSPPTWSVARTCGACGGTGTGPGGGAHSPQTEGRSRQVGDSCSEEGLGRAPSLPPLLPGQGFLVGGRLGRTRTSSATPILPLSWLPLSHGKFLLSAGGDVRAWLGPLPREPPVETMSQ